MRALNPHLPIPTSAQTADSHANDLRRAVNANIGGQININTSGSTLVAPIKPVTLAGPAVDPNYQTDGNSTTVSQSQSAKSSSAIEESKSTNRDEVLSSASSKSSHISHNNAAMPVSSGWVSTGVKSGNAKAFNPNLLVSKSALVEGDNNDGIFVARSPDAYIIEQVIFQNQTSMNS